MKFSIKNFFSKCDQICTVTEEILNGKLHFFFCSKTRNRKLMMYISHAEIYLPKKIYDTAIRI